MEYKAIAARYKGYIAEITGTDANYKYSRVFVSSKQKKSNKYADIAATLAPGIVYEFREVYEGTRKRQGFYELLDGVLVEVSDDEVLKYADSGTPSYPHEIYEEIDNPTYEGSEQ